MAAVEYYGIEDQRLQCQYARDASYVACLFALPVSPL